MALSSPLDHLPRRDMFADVPPQTGPFSRDGGKVLQNNAQNMRADMRAADARGRIEPTLAPEPRQSEASAVQSKSKGGRPAKHPDKPWEAAGISRMTWYRRRKNLARESNGG